MGKDAISSSFSKSEVVLSIVLYSLCSGTLVLLNKVILHHLPYPSLVVSFQLAAAIATILALRSAGIIAVDPIRWKYVVPYAYYIVAFSLGVYCNMRSLSEANVETVIVFRALSPCIVAFLDALYLGREMPNRRSWLGMLVLVLGACGYATTDRSFEARGLATYKWPFLYLCIISFEMAYGKSIIRSVDLKTLSGPVLYTNLLGLVPMLAFAAMGNEYQSFRLEQFEQPVSKAAVFFLTLGCVVGTGIGYSSWWCRDKVSATSFTLIGVVNKVLTILLNYFAWDKHAAPRGILCLLLCLVGGSIYQQAPLRSRDSLSSVANEVEGVWNDDFTEEADDDGEDDDLSVAKKPLISSRYSDNQGRKRRNAV
jgi:drug/metabolite transporter (DMT)-like permease